MLRKQSIISVAACAFFGLASCGSDANVADKGNREVSQESDSCGRKIALLAKRNDAFLHSHSDADRRLFDDVMLNCSASYERDFQLGTYLYLTGDKNLALPILEKIKSSDQKFEPKRLLLLYSIYLNSDGDMASSVAAEANSVFPESPYSRAMKGIELCQSGRCKEAGPDLIEANAKIKTLGVLAYLGASYVDGERYDEAARCFHVFASDRKSIVALDDFTAYAAVVAFANTGKYSDAVRVYENFVADVSKGKKTENLDNALEVVNAVKGMK